MAPSVLIAFGHTAGVGKDAAAAVLVRRGFTRAAFADPVYQIAYQTDPKIRAMVDFHGWDVVKRAHPAARLHLVELGNALRRNLGPAVLIDALFAQIHDGGDYVIADLRYPAEIQAVLERGGRVAKIVRPGVWPGNNTADQALAGFDGWSSVIENDSTLDALAKKVLALIP